jgi:DNA-binding NtrC family response regulator
VLERAIVLADGDVLTLPRLEATDAGASATNASPTRPLADVVRAAKVAAIDRALVAGGTQARAAELLGLKPPSLSRMIRDLGLRR